MGREIRMVPKGWEHPKNDSGDYKPLFDKDFETAARAWKENFLAWENGTHESLIKRPEYKQEHEFWEWDGDPPDRESFRPQWTEEPTCFQMYETVSEGTPVSPVFETEEDLVKWLITQGHSEHAAREFVKHRWAPSGVFHGGVFASNVDMYDLPR